MAKSVYLLTGSMGCIGAWVLRHLLDQNADIIATDVDLEPTRPRLLMSEEELARIRWEKLDVTDNQAVAALVKDGGVTHIIHLAGMQIPFCKANPSLGAAVNVTGTVNMLEAARHNNVSGISYASSVGVMGTDDFYPEKPVMDDATLYPSTLYGVYKTANEDTARIYWQDWQVNSVGLRPYVVYGIGRDQGMTADIAKAILASAAGKPFHIRFDGMVALQHASDVARIFIDSANCGYQGATVCNLRGDVISVAEIVAALKQQEPAAQVTFEENATLPYPADYDDSGLRKIMPDTKYMALSDAITMDLKHYKALLANNQIDLTQLDR